MQTNIRHDWIGHNWTAIWQSPAIRQSAIVMTGTTLTGVLAGISQIILSRHLGPEVFGIFTVMTVIVMVVAKLIDLGLNALITRYYAQCVNDQEQGVFIDQIFWRKLIVGSLVFGVGVLTLPIWLKLLRYAHPGLLLLGLVGGITTAWFEHLMAILNAQHRFWLSTGILIGQVLLKIISFVLLIILSSYSVLGYALLYVAAPLLALIVLPNTRTMVLRARPKQNVWSMSRQRYWLHSAIGVLAMVWLTNIDIILVQRYLTSWDTGIYAGVSRIASFVSFAALSLGTVLNNRAARYTQAYDQWLFLKKAWAIVGLALVGFVLFMPLNTLVINVTIGPQYLAGTKILLILMANGFLSVAVIPFMAYFYSIDKPYFFSVGGLMQALLATFLSGYLMSTYGLVGAALARLATTLVFCIYTLIMLWRFRPGTQS